MTWTPVTRMWVIARAVVRRNHCPRCDAPPGTRCWNLRVRTPKTVHTTEPHRERYALWHHATVGLDPAARPGDYAITYVVSCGAATTDGDTDPLNATCHGCIDWLREHRMLNEETRDAT